MFLIDQILTMLNFDQNCSRVFDMHFDCAIAALETRKVNKRNKSSVFSAEMLLVLKHVLTS